MPSERREASGKLLNSTLVSVKNKSSWTARFRRKSEEHQQEKKKQLQDYTAWVNNYLKRKSAIPLVTDIRSNFQDGITFVYLTEIVAHVKLEGVDRQPVTLFSRRVNIDRAVEFLQKDGVSFQGDPVKDIVEGNSKAILKVILAIAERYNPRSVKLRPSIEDGKAVSGQWDMTHGSVQLEQRGLEQRGSQSPDRVPHGLSSSMAFNSCSVPNMVSLSVGGVGGSMRSKHRARYAVSTTLANPGPPLPAVSRSPCFVPPAVATPSSAHKGKPERQFKFPDKAVPQHRTSSSGFPPQDADNDLYSTPVDTLPPSLGTRTIQPKRKPALLNPGLMGQHQRQSMISMHRSTHSPDDIRGAGPIIAMSSPVHTTLLAAPPQADLVLGKEVNLLLSGLSEFKAELLELHTLLLKNSNGGSRADLTDLCKKIAKQSNKTILEDEDLLEEDGGNAPEGINIMPTGDYWQQPLGTPLSSIEILLLEEKEQQLMERDQEIASLHIRISELQDELAQVQSESITLRSMVEERGAFITTMKSEIYRKEYKSDTEKLELRNQMLQREANIKKLEGELELVKDNTEANLTELDKISSKLKDKEDAELELTAVLDAMKEDLSRHVELEGALQGKLSSRERRITYLEDKMTDMQYDKSRNISPEDVDSVRGCLSQLRTSLAPQDHQQRLLDALEQTISDLISRAMERVCSPTGKRRRQRDGEDQHHRERLDKDRRGRRHREKHSTHNTSLGGLGGGGGDLVHQAVPTDTPGGMAESDVTKVFCYMLSDKTETPYVTLVPCKSNGIMLRDFKTVFDRQGSFRFYFKTEDPDCGVVKEEIRSDDQFLPMWKGKIHVWVSEKGLSK